MSDRKLKEAIRIAPVGQDQSVVKKGSTIGNIVRPKLAAAAMQSRREGRIKAQQQIDTHEINPKSAQIASKERKLTTALHMQDRTNPNAVSLHKTESISSLYTTEKAKVAIRENGDRSWTAKIIAPNGDVFIHSNKNRDTLKRLVNERYLAPNKQWLKKGSQLKEAKVNLNAKRRLAMETRRNNRPIVEAMHPNIVQDLSALLKQDLKGVPRDEAIQHIGKAVTEYLSHITWSQEKEEWDNHMTPAQKQQFIETFYSRLFPNASGKE